MQGFAKCARLFVGLVSITCSAAGVSTATEPDSQISSLRAAAECGSVDASFNLGVMYEHSDGVPENLPEAVKYYRQAAEAGDYRAQNNLGWILHKGKGVPRDDIEADMWLRLAIKSASPIRSRLCLFYVEMLMSRHDVEQAQKLVDQWRIKPIVSK